MSQILRTMGLLFALSALGLQAQVSLRPVNSFGINGDGSIRPGDVPFLTSSNQWQRGMAYNPTTGHLLVVDRSTNTTTSVNNDVYIIDGNTGLAVTNEDGSPKKLDNSSTLPGGNASFLLNLIGVADDGSIYVVNLTSSSYPPQTRIYRWENESASQTFVYNGDPSNGTAPNTAGPRRWGDTMAVRGSGMNTQIILGNRGTNVAILTPADPSLTSFNATTLATDAPVGGFSIGLTFGKTNDFWATAGGFNNGPLLHMVYDLNEGTATTLQSYPTPAFPGTVSPILVIPSSNLLAGITTVPGADIVRLYDISNGTNAPVLLDREPFPTAHNNANFAGSLAFGTNGILYALDSDNGIMAFNIVSAPAEPLAPAFYLSPATQLAIAGNELTLVAAADGDQPISYQWRLNGTNIVDATNSTLVFTNVQLSDAGAYTVVASNAVGEATSSTGTLTVATSAPSGLLQYDPIPYAPGSNITGQGNWSSPNAAQSTTFKATNGNLVVEGLAPSEGNMITWPLTPAASIRLTNGPVTASGSIFYSFAYRIDNLGNLAPGGAGSTIAGFVPNFTAATYAPKINVRKDASGEGYNIGAFKGSGETTGFYATNVFTLGETVFIVGRYIFGESGTASAADDIVAIWLNPPSTSFGTTNVPAPSVADFGAGAADMDQVVGFALRTSGGPSLSFADEVRVGLSWADVTPTPFSSPSLAIAAESGSSVRITWPSAASGFILETAPSLNQPIAWSSVTNNVTVVGTNNSVTINASSGNQFFRLKR